MSFTEKRLCNPTQLTTSGQTLYTVPSSKTSIVKQIVVTNVTASAATFSLYIGSAATPNALFSATSVAANDTIVVNLSQVLNAGEILTALASTNSTLNITISGVENDGPLNPLSTYVADSAITTAKIADASVTTAKIADGAVVTADIAANAVTQAKLSTDIPLSGMRNVIINGNFDVWQRGTPLSTDNGATVIYTADRWAARALYPNSSAVQTITQEATNVPSGSKYSLKSTISTAAVVNNSRMELCYTVEDRDAIKLAGKTLTLSMQVKAIQNIDRVTITPTYSTTGGRVFGGTAISATNFTINTSSFTTCTVTFAAPSVATLTTAGTIGFIITYTRSSGAAEQVGDGIYLAQVQLETGSQVTPFEQRPIGIEIELCQRYYYLHVSGYNKAICHGHYYSANGFEGFLTLPTRMRTTPTMDYVQGTNYYNIYSTGNDLSNYVFLDGYSTDTMVALYDNATATGTAGYGGMYLTNNAASYVAFKAEL